MTSVSKPSPLTQRLAWSRLGLITLVAMLGAAITNVVVYLLAGAIGVDWSFVVPEMGAPIPVMAPLMASLIGVGLGMALFAALNAFTQQPVRWFTWFALIVGLLSLGAPLTIAGAPLDLKLSLVAMHIVAVAFTVLTPRLLSARAAR